MSRYVKLPKFTGNYGFAVSPHQKHRLIRVMSDRHVVHEVKNRGKYKISVELMNRFVGRLMSKSILK